MGLHYSHDSFIVSMIVIVLLLFWYTYNWQSANLEVAPPTVCEWVALDHMDDCMDDTGNVWRHAGSKGSCHRCVGSYLTAMGNGWGPETIATYNYNIFSVIKITLNVYNFKHDLCGSCPIFHIQSMNFMCTIIQTSLHSHICAVDMSLSHKSNCLSPKCVFALPIFMLVHAHAFNWTLKAE